MGQEKRNTRESKWRLKGRGVLILIITLTTLAVLAIVAIGRVKELSKPPSRTSNTHSTRPTTPPASSPSPSGTASASPAKPTPQILLDIQGSATKQTKVLMPTRDWDLSWSYDCSSTGSTGKFVVVVYDEVGRSVRSASSVSESGSKGAGVRHYPKGTEYFLGINSECPWHIVAKD